MKRIALRADGSSKIGMGHVMRCLALAEMLQGEFEMDFVIYKADEAVKKLISDYNLNIIEIAEQTNVDYSDAFDAVIVDGYWFNSDYIKALKQKNKKVIQVDDLIGADFFADLVINHALGADYSTSKFHNGGKLFAGSEYAMLRKEFLHTAKPARDLDQPQALTICMGGADPLNYTLLLLKCIHSLKQNLHQINILIGVTYSHKQALNDWIKQNPDLNVKIQENLGTTALIDLFSATDLLICPASTIVYEAAAVGVPLGCFLTAGNQSAIYKGLVDGNFVIGLGDLQKMKNDELIKKLETLFSDYKKVAGCVEKQHQLIDGKSGDRIKSAVKALWD